VVSKKKKIRVWEVGGFFGSQPLLKGSTRKTCFLLFLMRKKLTKTDHVKSGSESNKNELQSLEQNNVKLSLKHL
jgi:hypothetical protein